MCKMSKKVVILTPNANILPFLTIALLGLINKKIKA